MMLQNNPLRMDYYKKYQEIVADYNREKDRVTVEETFAKLLELAGSLDACHKGAPSRKRLTDDELALFRSLLFKRTSRRRNGSGLKQGRARACWRPSGSS